MINQINLKKVFAPLNGINLLFYLLLVSAYSVLIAQQSDIKFEHISLEQGLSQSIINTIMKDSKGFM